MIVALKVDVFQPASAADKIAFGRLIAIAAVVMASGEDFGSGKGPLDLARMNVDAPDFLAAVADEVLLGYGDAGRWFAVLVQPAAVPYRRGHRYCPGQVVDHKQISRRGKSDGTLVLP